MYETRIETFLNNIEDFPRDYFQWNEFSTICKKSGIGLPQFMSDDAEYRIRDVVHSCFGKYLPGDNCPTKEIIISRMLSKLALIKVDPSKLPVRYQNMMILM